jgi:hypothetical protein
MPITHITLPESATAKRWRRKEAPPTLPREPTEEEQREEEALIPHIEAAETAINSSCLHLTQTSIR